MVLRLALDKIFVRYNIILYDFVRVTLDSMQATALMKPVALPRTQLLNVVLNDLTYEVLCNISYSVILIVVQIMQFEKLAYIYLTLRRSRFSSCSVVQLLVQRERMQ